MSTDQAYLNWFTALREKDIFECKKLGANLDANKVVSGHCALDSAIRSNSIEKINYVLKEKKANPNVTSEKLRMTNDIKDDDADCWDFRTFLTTAIELLKDDSLPVVELLVEAGADVNKAVSGDRPPLFCAISYQKLDLVKFFLSRPEIDLRQRCSGSTLLHTAAGYTSIPILKEILAKKDVFPSVNILDDDKRPVIFECLSLRGDKSLRLAVLQLLLDQGADPNVTDPIDDFATPLHVACRLGSIDFVRLLVEKGAKIDGPKQKTKFEESPLSLAVKKKAEFIVKYLCEKGANPSTSTMKIKGGAKVSCLVYAQRKGLTNILTVFKDFGSVPEHTEFPTYKKTPGWDTVDEEKVTLLYDFKSGGTGQIECKKGDVVIIKEKYKSEWYKGKNERTSEYGMVPISYCKLSNAAAAKEDDDLDALLRSLDAGPTTTTNATPAATSADDELDALLRGLETSNTSNPPVAKMSEEEARKLCAEKYGCRARTLDPKHPSWVSHYECIKKVVEHFKFENTPNKLFTYSESKYTKEWPLLTLSLLYPFSHIKYPIALVDHGVPLDLKSVDHDKTVSILRQVMTDCNKEGFDWLMSIWEKDNSQVPWTRMNASGVTLYYDMMVTCGPTKEDTLLQIYDVLVNKVKIDLNYTEKRSHDTYDWWTPLPIQNAARYRSIKVVKWFIDHGADVNKAGGEYGSSSALSNAAMNSDIPMAKLLLAHRAKLLDDESSQRPPMFAAAVNGKIDFIEWMVKDLHVDIKTMYGGETVLHVAAVNYSHICPRLIQLGADEAVLDSRGRTWQQIVDSVASFSLPKGHVPMKADGNAPAAPTGGPPPPKGRK